MAHTPPTSPRVTLTKRSKCYERQNTVSRAFSKLKTEEETASAPKLCSLDFSQPRIRLYQLEVLDKYQPSVFLRRHLIIGTIVVDEIFLVLGDCQAITHLAPRCLR